MYPVLDGHGRMDPVGGGGGNKGSFIRYVCLCVDANINIKFNVMLLGMQIQTPRMGS